MGCFSCLFSPKKIIKIEDTDRARSASRTSGINFLKNLLRFLMTLFITSCSFVFVFLVIFDF